MIQPPYLGCVLAETEREKGKKALLALASKWRRVESAPSPMKKDQDHNSTDSAEIGKPSVSRDRIGVGAGEHPVA
jgi:hypothetical protein